MNKVYMFYCPDCGYTKLTDELNGNEVSRYIKNVAYLKKCPKCSGKNCGIGEPSKEVGIVELRALIELYMNNENCVYNMPKEEIK